MDEIRHPLLRHLYGYWSQKRDGRKLPRRSDIDPTELPAELWPHLLLQDVIINGDAVRFRYTVVGQHFRDQIGRHVTGTFSDVSLAPLGSYARYVIELFADTPRWLAEPDRFLDELDTLYTRRGAAAGAPAIGDSG